MPRSFRSGAFLLFLFAAIAVAKGETVIKGGEETHPLAFLSNEAFTSKAQLGIGVAVAFFPEIQGVKTAADVTKIAVEEVVKSADVRNEIVATHLLLINKEAERLEEIMARDGNLRSPEAAAILSNIRNDPFHAESTAMFLTKSVFSLRVVAGTAGHYGLDKAMKFFFGKFLARRMPIGEKVERLWISKRSPVRRHLDIKWKYLTQLGRDSRKISDALLKVMLQTEGKKLGKETFGRELDDLVKRILAEHPSRREAVYVLRFNIMNAPRLLVEPSAAAAPAPAAAMPLVLPATIRIQQDPVIRPANVQHQIISAQSSGDRDSPRSSVNLPSSISVGGSFTGGRGSSLTTRF